jgi:hypothetical protein
MAYTSATNTKILEFLERAQTKVSLCCVAVTNGVSNSLPYQVYKDEAEIADGLIIFVSSLDNVFNDWTEAEIIKYIDLWTLKANLASVPFYDYTTFNTRITFT